MSLTKRDIVSYNSVLDTNPFALTPNPCDNQQWHRRQCTTMAFPDRLCFHCGVPGHRAAKCPSRDAQSPSCVASTASSQTSAGREAFQRYLATHSRRSSEHVKGAREREPGYHFDKVVQWMKDAECCTGDQRQSPLALARDPIEVLQREATNTLDNSQQWNDLHRSKYNDYDKAHREAFSRAIGTIRHCLAEMLHVTASDEAASTWHDELTRAVEFGRPADFSVNLDKETNDSNNSEGRCLKVYAVEKLQPRCRQLHHLLMNDNPFSTRVRSQFLLPFPKKLDAKDEQLSVVSIGGGPGYDHVAISLAAKFLYDVQPHQRQLQMRCINTQIFDLFHEEWGPSMSSLGECLNDTLFEESNCHMTMNHCDLRKGMDDALHADHFRDAVESADIICAQFVLHENASFILEEVDEDGEIVQKICGAVRDILARAKVASFMICSDSANTLFPALKSTAREYGWSVFGEEEQRDGDDRIAYLGPKSFVMLERIAIPHKLQMII